jgi:hypothetical protein
MIVAEIALGIATRTDGVLASVLSHVAWTELMVIRPVVGGPR